MSDQIIGYVGRTGRQSLDLGHGLHVLRHGMDVNGNHCVYVSYRGGRARKIQTLGLHEVNGERGYGPKADKLRITRAGGDEIVDYYEKYMVKGKR